MKRILILMIMLAIILVLSFNVSSSEPPKVNSVATTIDKEAITAATAWLKLVDDVKYDTAWDQAGELIKKAATKADFNKQLKAVLEPLGKLKSRTQKTAEAKKTLPGAPDGEYVVFQFNTSFEKKEKAVETLTTQKEKDGKWRVVGYFIK